MNGRILRRTMQRLLVLVLLLSQVGVSALQAASPAYRQPAAPLSDVLASPWPAGPEDAVTAQQEAGGAALMETVGATDAASTGFTLRGPASGRIRNIRFDPQNPDRVWALFEDDGTVNRSGYGVVTSEDGGATWQVHASEQRFTSYSFSLSRYIEVDPGNSQVLYSDGYKSLDQAQHWLQANSVDTGGAFSASQLVVAPANPQTLYARTNGDIYRSTDGSVSWTLLPYPGSRVDGIAVDPADADTVYGYGVGTSGGETCASNTQGNCLFKSIDGGDTWVDITPAIDTAPIDTGDTVYYAMPLSLAVVPGDGQSQDAGQPSTLYAAAQGRTYSYSDDEGGHSVGYGGVYRSTDGGVTWQAVNNGLPLTQFPNNASRYTDFINIVAPQTVEGSDTDRQTLYVVASDSIAVTAGNYGYAAAHSLYVTRDGGTSWQQVTPADEDPLHYTHISEVAVRAGAQQNQNRALVTLVRRTRQADRVVNLASGLFRSDDNGVTWQHSDNGLSNQDYVWVQQGPDALYAYVQGQGLLRSADGSSWTVLSPYLIENNIEVSSLVFDPADPQILYIGTGNDPNSGPAFGILRSTDGGVTWSARNLGVGATPTRMVGVVQTSPPTFFAMKNLHSRIPVLVKSSDGGASWTDVADAPNILEMHPHPTNQSVIYARTPAQYGGDTSHLYKSTNGGDSWSDLGNNADVFAVDANNPERLYRSSAPGATGNESREGIDISDDGGASWRTVQAGNYGVGRRLYAVLPSDPTILIGVRREASGCSYQQVWTDYSVDGGESWSVIDKFAGGKVVAGAVDRANGGSAIVYMIGGAFTLGQGSASFCGSNVLVRDGRSGLWSHTFSPLPTEPPARPTVAFSASNYEVSEDAASAVVTVTLTGEPLAGTQVTVVTTNGSASSGSDYSGIHQTITFEPGETEKAVTIPITKNEEVEPDETVNLALQSPVYAALGSQVDAVLTILDGGAPPAASFSAESYGADELAGQVAVTVTLSSVPLVETTVSYTVQDGSATMYTDYSPENYNGSLTFAAGQRTQVIYLNLQADILIETDETLHIQLTDATQATIGSPAAATVTIRDHLPPTFQFTEATYATSEAAGEVTLTVTASEPMDEETTLSYYLQDGTASSYFSDYSDLGDGTLIFPAGETTQQVRITIVQDGLSEGLETFQVVLSPPYYPPTFATLGSPSTATVSILAPLYLPSISSPGNGNPPPSVTPEPGASPTPVPDASPTPEPAATPPTSQVGVSVSNVPDGAETVRVRVSAPDMGQEQSGDGTPSGGTAQVVLSIPDGNARLVQAEALGTDGAVLARTADVFGTDGSTAPSLAFPAAVTPVDCSTAGLSVTEAAPGSILQVTGVAFPTSARVQVLLNGAYAPSYVEAGGVLNLMLPLSDAAPPQQTASFQLILDGTLLDCPLPALTVLELPPAPGESQAVVRELAGLLEDLAASLPDDANGGQSQEEQVVQALRDQLLERMAQVAPATDGDATFDAVLAQTGLLADLREARANMSLSILPAAERVGALEGAQVGTLPNSPTRNAGEWSSETHPAFSNARNVIARNQALAEFQNMLSGPGFAKIKNNLTLISTWAGFAFPQAKVGITITMMGLGIVEAVVKFLNDGQYQITAVYATPPDTLSLAAGGESLAWSGGSIDVRRKGATLDTWVVVETLYSLIGLGADKIPTTIFGVDIVESQKVWMRDAVDLVLGGLFMGFGNFVQRGSGDPFTWTMDLDERTDVPLGDLAHVGVEPAGLVAVAEAANQQYGVEPGGIQGCAAGTVAVTVGVDAEGLQLAEEIGDAAHDTFTLTVSATEGRAASEAACPGFKQLEGGNNHTLGVRWDGYVWAWGDNTHGQLGNGSHIASSVPVTVGLVTPFTDVVSVAAGMDFSLALLENGAVWSWGRNDVGQLGDTTTVSTDYPVPALLPGNIKEIAAGERYALAVDHDGRVWAWGHNGYGQLGDGTTTNRAEPVLIAGLTGVAAVAAGRTHSLALKEDGTVWAWGYNGAGQLGDRSNEDRLTPVQVYNLGNVKAIAAGGMHSVALKTDGTVWAWGYNKYGQLGNGHTRNLNFPVRVYFSVTAIAAGYLHTSIMHGDGSVWSWGRNNVGQLGNNSTGDSHHATVAGLTEKAAAIGAGAYHSLAVTTLGRGWAWGQNSHGELGDGSKTNRPAPVAVQ